MYPCNFYGFLNSTEDISLRKFRGTIFYFVGLANLSGSIKMLCKYGYGRPGYVEQITQKNIFIQFCTLPKVKKHNANLPWNKNYLSAGFCDS